VTAPSPPGQTIAASYGNLGIVCGDFTGDGKLDLVAVSGLGGTATLLAGNGDGTFHAAGSFAAGVAPLGVTAGDFTGDGKPDLAIADYATGSVSIFRNNGAGTFSKFRQYAVAGHPALAITAGDFTGSGKLDLAVGNADAGSVSILLGHGYGTFTAGATVAVGQYPQSIVAGDFTGDGKLDLAVANLSSNTVSVLRGNGDGTFTPLQQLPTGAQPWQVVAADFNGDGRADLATVNVADGTVSIFLGRSGGTFEAGQRLVAGSSPTALVAGDFHHGGTPDLAVLDRTADQVRILLGHGDGTFQSLPPQTPGTRAYDVVSADFNGDGIPDLAVTNLLTPDVTILLGQGDGTFRFGGKYSAGGPILHITVGDLRGNGIADLITSDSTGTNVNVLLGHGDGTFGPPTGFFAGPIDAALTVGDFNDDGRLDVAVTVIVTHQVAILEGDGTGKLSAPVYYAVGNDPQGITAGDFNRDGHPDLAVTDYGDNTVSVLLNNGDGTFAPQVVLNSGPSPYGIVAGDFTGQGNLDLATADYGGGISIFRRDGTGHFAPATTLAAPPGTFGVLAGDFDHDGKLDLAAYSENATGLSVYRGNGDGTFQPAQPVACAEQATGGVVGYFSGGNLDLVTADDSLSQVSLYVGKGDGTFRAPLRFSVSSGPAAVAGADFNGDGTLDLVTANPTLGSIAVSLGNGDGTFLDPVTTTLGGEPVAVVTGDFNRDGRTDIAVADYLHNSVVVLLGNGDGTFRAPAVYAVGLHPDALVVRDFTGDGILDLAIADFGDGTVKILLGNGDGTFRAGQRISVGAGPVSLAAGDGNGDGKTDLVVANSRSHSLSILEGAGDGTFRLAADVPLGAVPDAVAVGDFTGSGRRDIAVAEQARNTVAVLLGNGNGTFQAPVAYSVGLGPVALVVADFNGDGKLDIAAADAGSASVTVLLGRGDGTFGRQPDFSVGDHPLALLAGDFNNSGRPGFASVNGLGQTTSVALGLGDGTFVNAAFCGQPTRSTPLVGDLKGDGTADVAILAANGQILVRFGNPGAPGTFAPPVVVNPDSADRAQDLTLVTVNGRLELAALDARDNTISFYAYADGSLFVRTRGPAMPAGLPVRIIAGDLTGDGRQDLVVATVGLDFGQVAVYLQRPDGTFGPAAYQQAVGPSPSDLALLSLTGGPGLDVVVTDRVSGEVRILQNTGSSPFATQLAFSTGVEVHTLLQLGPTNRKVIAPDGPTALVAGNFGSGPGLVVLNHEADRFDLLTQDGYGGLFNPVSSLSYRAGTNASAIVTGDFSGDDTPYFAVLDQASHQILIYRADGRGGFVPQDSLGPDGQPQGIDAGNQPTGLAVADLAGDGRFDLLVGNAQGDVLVLLGNGDGTFRPYQRLDRHVALAVLPGLPGAGPRFVFANQALDRVTVESSQSGALFQQGRQDGLLAPTAVKLADLNGDGIPDLIVANGGGNDVLVYLGLGNGEFGPGQAFYVGTDPVGITVADLTGDGIPDLIVANHGSNDISILFGQSQGASWTLTQGPRLRAGAGPVSTVVADYLGRGLPDLLVANSESNNVYLLPGVGQGFFDDRDPQIFQTGSDPVQLIVGHFDNQPGLDLLTVNAGSNDLTLFSGLGPGRSVSTDGGTPVAAVAGDFTHDGATDLVVASYDGRVTLLMGGADGPRVAKVLAPTGLFNVSDLALGGMTGDRLELYAAVEGTDAAMPLNFVFDAAEPANLVFTPGLLPALSTALPADGTPPATVNDRVAEFSSPSGSPLEVVVVLIVGPQEAPPKAEPAGEASIRSVDLSIQGDAVSEVSAAQRSLGSGTGEGEETEEDAVPPTLAEGNGAGDVYRRLVITGAAETPLLQHLGNAASSQPSPADALFSSPLEFFNGLDQGTSGRSRPDAPEGVEAGPADAASSSPGAARAVSPPPGREVTPSGLSASQDVAATPTEAGKPGPAQSPPAAAEPVVSPTGGGDEASWLGHERPAPAWLNPPGWGRPFAWTICLALGFLAGKARAPKSVRQKWGRDL
jgi:hypothetical protein